MFNKRARISEMYEFFRDETKECGRKFSYRKSLSFLRGTHDWAMTVTPNMSGTDNTVNGTDDLDGNRGISSNEDNVADLALFRNGSVGDRSVNSEMESLRRTGTESEQTPPVGPVRIRRANRSNEDMQSPQQLQRPLGSKRYREVESQANALQSGADAIEELAKASRRRNELTAELVGIERRREEAERTRMRVELFSMEGTSADRRARFFAIQQEAALVEMEESLQVDQVRGGVRHVDVQARHVDVEEQDVNVEEPNLNDQEPDMNVQGEDPIVIPARVAVSVFSDLIQSEATTVSAPVESKHVAHTADSTQ